MQREDKDSFLTFFVFQIIFHFIIEFIFEFDFAPLLLCVFALKKSFALKILYLSTTTGSLTMKVEPRFSPLLSTETAPPCSSVN